MSEIHFIALMRRLRFRPRVRTRSHAAERDEKCPNAAVRANGHTRAVRNANFI